jgi:two-component system LytT family response regulator
MPLSSIRVVVIEDQPEVRNDTKLLVEQQKGFIVVGSCGSVKEANQLISQLKPDLLLLDIHLPDGTGFDVLKEYPYEFKVIFLTAFEKHAIQAIKFGALDYLLKPINEEDLAVALNKSTIHFPTKEEQLRIARLYHQDGIHSKLVLRSQDYLQVVDIQQVVYCHSDSGYTTFYLSDKRKTVVSKILKDYEDILNEPAFLRPHQSYLVNINYIDRYRRDGFIQLKTGEDIPVSTRRKEAVIEFFNRL